MARTSLNEGHFARKQLFSKSGLIRWSHRRRFEVAVEKSAAFAGKRVLDFGCGDATYFAMLLESPYAPSEAVGAEIDPNVVAQNRVRFADQPRVSFAEQNELEGSVTASSFDAVVCMEVFEHLTDPDRYLDLISKLLKPGGRLLLSVPVETGPPVVFKQAVRRVAGWRKIGDYKYTLPYTWSELGRSVFAGSDQHIPRVTHHAPGGATFHCHKGFNWMTLRDRIAKRFTIDRISASPVAWLPPTFSSQVWFEAHKAA
jgi:SAM-dependent methyltransferase